jgi:hypothetical protein
MANRAPALVRAEATGEPTASRTVHAPGCEPQTGKKGGTGANSPGDKRNDTSRTASGLRRRDASQGLDQTCGEQLHVLLATPEPLLLTRLRG